MRARSCKRAAVRRAAGELAGPLIAAHALRIAERDQQMAKALAEFAPLREKRMAGIESDQPPEGLKFFNALFVCSEIGMPIKKIQTLRI
jgi:hypothetical protein